ncbi:MAG TPA: response regulator [Gammaproteobacteria bacterium]|nr:response regulator [Gammaproteobacteria bacterium]
MAHILIVDDSPTEVYVFRTMLEKHGYTVSVATSGEEGVEKIRGERPDLVLMDIVMPGLNGFQATRQLTKDPDTSSIPVVILSTKGQESDRVWGLRQGAKDYLAKPVNEELLVGKIHSILSEHQGSQ